MNDMVLNALAGGAVGSAATALVTFFLKDFFTSTRSEFHDLTKAVNEQIRATLALTHECKTLQRDLSKVEGVIENQQKQLGMSIKETATLLANIKALWNALERIHPTHLPVRASERGKGKGGGGSAAHQPDDDEET